MAKGLRSSKLKANRAKLRSRVFSPTEDARKKRLSAKLLEIAAKPKPSVTEAEDSAMKEDAEAAKQQLQIGTEAKPINPDQDMDIDETTAAVGSIAAPKSTSIGRVEKRGRGKARATMVFPVYKKGKVFGMRKKQKG